MLTDLEREKCTCSNPSTKACKKPFYDAFDLCLVCSHTRTCHEDLNKTTCGLETQEINK
jgi:hypothetical protein